jgi:hypothetical protein
VNTRFQPFISEGRMPWLHKLESVKDWMYMLLKRDFGNAGGLQPRIAWLKKLMQMALEFLHALCDALRGTWR